MSKMARTATAALATVLTTVGLEAAPLPGFSLAAQTEHFSFYTRGQKVDAGKSERYLAEVERLLGHKLAGRAEYYRYSTPEEIAVGTGRYAEGVTFPHAAQIHSTQDFHAHEIVHLVAGQLGNPGSFFQEGLAVALGSRGKWQGKDVDALARDYARRAEVTSLVAGFDRMDPQVSYPVAGSFVSRLIKAHGFAKVAAFFRAAGGANVEAAFASTFGQSLEEAGDAWARSL